MANNSELPTNPSFQTNKRLSSVRFSAEDIGKTIQGLDPSKARRHDDISIHMLKICGDSICKPLEMIFSQALTSGSFSSEWKKDNIVHIQKKNDKQNLESYHPVFLLTIYVNIFEILIFKT